MRRLIVTLMPLATLTLGWLFLQHYRIEGIDELRLIARQHLGGADAAGWSGAASGAPPAEHRETITVATFNIQALGEAKLARPHIVGALVAIIRRFDIVAVQEIRAESQDLMPRLLAAVNADGARYDYVIGPRLGRTSSKEQYAFLFNTATVEVDRGAVYTVADPDDLLHREPLVAPFRVRGPPPQQAFTFTLVNVHVDPDEVPAELTALAGVFRAVRGDGRGEDDIILLGDFNADNHRLEDLLPYVHPLVSGIASNTRATRLYDNFLLDRRACVEFTGNFGALDLVRAFNLTLDDALAISDHVPLWAEFRALEGGAGGPVAAVPQPAPARR